MNTVLHIDGKPVTLENLARKAQELSFSLAGKSYTFRSHPLPDGSFLLEREVAAGVWQRMSGSVWQGKDFRRVQLSSLEAKVTEPAANAAQGSDQAALSPLAPMPGLVRQMLVKAGERVKQGQAVAVMEAMKLQITLVAGGDAKVEKILVREGEMIAEGTELVRLTAEKAA
jgi:biotin carboxyl carrier protein